MSLAAAYFFFQKDANPCLKTKNSREKLTNEGAIMHLELRSPMFGESCICFFMGISIELMKSQGDFPHKWIFGNRHISCSS